MATFSGNSYPVGDYHGLQKDHRFPSKSCFLLLPYRRGRLSDCIMKKPGHLEFGLRQHFSFKIESVSVDFHRKFATHFPNSKLRSKNAIPSLGRLEVCAAGAGNSSGIRLVGLRPI
jgi:hypothetical protein